MLHKAKAFVTVFFLAMALTFCLSGCSDEMLDQLANEEDTTQVLAYIDDEEEEDSKYYSTEIIDDSWESYQITTNEIDYDPSEDHLAEDGFYTSEVDVATYIIEYNTLPDNFISKKEAKKAGWTGGSLEPYFGDDMCIGGDYFGNYEGILPQVDGRKYYECDIDTMGKKKRGAKRIIYSDDGQIYYTDDHYESFTLIYGTD